METSHNVIQDRRRGRDIGTRLLQMLTMISGILFFIVLIILFTTEMISGYSGYRTRFGTYDVNWRSSLLQTAFFIMIAQAVISLTGVILNAVRYKRKNDRFHTVLLISGVFSLIGITIYYLLVLA